MALNSFKYGKETTNARIYSCVTPNTSPMHKHGAVNLRIKPLRKQYLECEIALEILAHSIETTITVIDTNEQLFSYCGDSLEDALRAFQEQLKQEEAHL